MGENPMKNEAYILKKLFSEYVSLYHIELNSGKYEILRLADNTNARKIAHPELQPYVNYDAYTQKYAECFILEEERQEFLDWHLCSHMKKRLLENDTITYYYHSVSKDGKDSYYEAYAVKDISDASQCKIFLGYRNVDGILYKEKAIQKKLQKALDEAKLSNEIVSAIAKTYQYISRIDIQADRFEEISNREPEKMKFIDSGTLSINNRKTCRELVDEAYQEAFFKFTDITTLPERMRDEESIAMEYQMKNGDWHKMRFIEKKRDENGQLTHVLCAIRSVSDTKKKEQALLYQVAEAKKEAELKSRFLSNMSHDIRTPMNGIIGMLQLANRYPNDLEIQQKCRDKIMESSMYLVSMVTNILDLNKLESDDKIEKNLPFDLTTLLNQVNMDAQTLAESKNIEYRVEWEKADIHNSYLIGNPIYLEKILKEVADNAVKFTNPGGCIRVWCARQSEDAEQVVYEFVCEDNGIGMHEDFVGHAYDLFTQENENSRSEYQGVGLGLSIVQKALDKLDGTIDIESKKDRGTKVRMTIPFKIGEAVTLPKSKNETTINLKGRHALVVEDNALNMEIVKFILEENGIVTTCVEDGVEAVRQFEASVPGDYDMILMDIMLPNMNGWDAARRIRAMKRPDAGKIPMIAMSANAFSSDIMNSYIAGMNRHLAKPLDAEKLLDTIRECLAY